jgi:hypothetical protein
MPPVKADAHEAPKMKVANVQDLAFFLILKKVVDFISISARLAETSVLLR